MDPSYDPKVKHGSRCRPTLFKKQVFCSMDSPDPEGCTYSDHAADLGLLLLPVMDRQPWLTI